MVTPSILDFNIMRFNYWTSRTVATKQADELAERRKALTHGTYIVKM
jgi:hypothetical protein